MSKIIWIVEDNEGKPIMAYSSRDLAVAVIKERYWWDNDREFDQEEFDKVCAFADQNGFIEGSYNTYELELI